MVYKSESQANNKRRDRRGTALDSEGYVTGMFVVAVPEVKKVADLYLALGSQWKRAQPRNSRFGKDFQDGSGESRIA
jgi:hypothetical protein